MQRLGVFILTKLVLIFVYPTKAGKSPIPSHLFGNMWAQKWGNIYSLVEPFDKAGVRPDATPRGRKACFRLSLVFLELQAIVDKIKGRLNT